jgi:hypothetical protein
MNPQNLEFPHGKFGQFKNWFTMLKWAITIHWPCKCPNKLLIEHHNHTSKFYCPDCDGEHVDFNKINDMKQFLKKKKARLKN